MSNEDGSMSPTVAIPSASARMNDLVAMIRLYMRDYPELNRLIKGEETSDRMIAWAIADTIDDWNTTPPFLDSISISNFPSLSLLRIGAVIRILEGVALLQMRNHLSFTDGGISVSISDKAPMLMQWIQLYTQSYETKKSKMKASMNIELAMGGTGTFSEYFMINGVYLMNF